MCNMLILSDGTPWNTKEKNGVPYEKVKKSCPYYVVNRLYIYIGTPEHRNTNVSSSHGRSMVK